MTEIETYELNKVKLSLNVKTGKDAPKWSVAVNTTTVYGYSVTRTYTSCLSVYRTLKESLNTIARDLWRFDSCEHCGVMGPNVSDTTIWYTSEETNERNSYSEPLCEKCQEAFRKEGALKK